MSDADSYNSQVVAEFRASSGRSVGPQGLSLLLLHHVGAKSGVERVTPLAYWPLTDRAVTVLASNFGAPTNPAWYHNLLAHPRATVEIGPETWTVRARVATPNQRESLLPRIANQAPTVASAVSRSSREIPVVIFDLLSPVNPTRTGSAAIHGTIGSKMEARSTPTARTGPTIPTK